MLQQLRYLIKDYRTICGEQKWRLLYMWWSRIAVGIFIYRFERGMYLGLGKFWSAFRIIVSPVLNLLYAYSNCEINYHADIGPGILILHTSPGIVISGRSIIGKNLTLTGGNIIGAREGTTERNFVIGDNCSLGANAVVLGPIKLGNNIQIGACALVIHTYGDDLSLVGNPARPITKSI